VRPIDHANQSEGQRRYFDRNFQTSSSVWMRLFFFPIIRTRSRRFGSTFNKKRTRKLRWPLRLPAVLPSVCDNNGLIGREHLCHRLLKLGLRTVKQWIESVNHAQRGM
jgi:hypothetical protein